MILCADLCRRASNPAMTAWKSTWNKKTPQKIINNLFTKTLAHIADIPYPYGSVLAGTEA